MLLASPPASWVRCYKSTKIIWICVLVVLFVIIALGPNEWRFVDCKLDGTCETAQTRIKVARPFASAFFQESKSSICDVHLDPGNIAIVVKTAATQGFDRLPTQLITSLQCVKQPLIFSDLEQTLGRHRIHDALANVLPDAMDHNTDFDLYRKQKQLVAQSRAKELSKLKDLLGPDEDAKTSISAAVDGLDKYKILHMIQQAAKLQPERDWYVFIEDDTYVVWPNLLAWLKTLDPHKESFYGLPLQAKEDGGAFSDSGVRDPGMSALILSKASLRCIVVDNSGLATQWETRIADLPSAHSVVGAALSNIRIPFTDASALLSPADLDNVPFSPSSWCRPLITIPHTSLRHMHFLHQHLLAHPSQALTYRSIHNATSLASIPFKRGDWDNLASDPNHALEVINNTASAVRGNWEPKDLIFPHQNFEACEIACISNKRCLSFVFVTTWWEKREGMLEDERECFLSSVWRVGRERRNSYYPGERRGNRGWVSGWRADRIGRVVDDISCEQEAVHWSLGD